MRRVNSAEEYFCKHDSLEIPWELVVIVDSGSIYHSKINNIKVQYNLIQSCYLKLNRQGPYLSVCSFLLMSGRNEPQVSWCMQSCHCRCVPAIVRAVFFCQNMCRLIGNRILWNLSRELSRCPSASQKLGSSHWSCMIFHDHLVSACKGHAGPAH